MSGQPRWIPALVVACELLTIATGFVVGYVSVWFQLFGETADREDYLVSLGGYAAKKSRSRQRRLDHRFEDERVHLHQRQRYL